MKNQKGVSLITLVITIIVVIILAAIALGGGAADTAGQAQFSGFATEMGGLKESVQTAITTAKGDEAIRGNSRSNAQLANFVARGGAMVISGDSGDAMWLTQSDANAIPCTLIQKTYAKEVFGAKLPVRKVETFYGTNQEVSYYVTPKGQVFCWPPYTYDGKSYVTNNVTAKNGTITDNASYTAATEYAGTSATQAATVTLFFPETEEIVKVANSATPVTPTAVSRGHVASGDTAVWYSRTTSDATSGVAQGLTFGSYNNTLPDTPVTP